MALLAQGYITLTNINDGAAGPQGPTGSTGPQGPAGPTGTAYTLSVEGGTRGIAYAADGTNPNPATSTAFSVSLLKNGAKITPYSYSWTSGGNMSGSSTASTFTPTISKTFTSGNSFVTVKVKETSTSQEVSQTMPIISTKYADGLDWIADWNTGKTTISDKSIVTPRIFAGTNSGTSGAPNLTGVALGRDVLTGSTNTIGIVGYKTNKPVFKLDTSGNFLLSSNGDAGTVQNGTAKGLYWDGTTLSIAGKVNILSGSTIGSKNTSVDTVVSNSETGVQANGKIDGLQIGGANLVPNTNFQNLLEGWGTYNNGANLSLVEGRSSGIKAAQVTLANQGGSGFRTPTIDCIGRKVYTISFWVKSSQNMNFGSFMKFLDSAGAESNPIPLVAKAITSGTWTKIETTITTPSTAVKMFDTPRIDAAPGNTTTTIAITEYQIEEGNRATTWTPASSDVDEVLGDINGVVNEIGGIVSENKDGWSSAAGRVDSWTTKGTTTIDGGSITTNSIKADKIDVLGLSVNRVIDNTVNPPITESTFSIDTNGNVDINGTLTSSNYDPLERTGYKITPDGYAILNQASIRGSVELPNAGLTNYGDTIGNQNWARDSEYKTTSDFKNIDNQSIFSQRVDMPSGAKVGDTIAVSYTFEYNGVERSTTSGSIYFQGSGNVTAWAAGAWNGGPRVGNEIDWGAGKVGVVEMKYTFVLSADQIKNAYFSTNFRCNYISTGTVTLKYLKVELSNKHTPWCAYKDEQSNYIRIWAGSTYQARNSAPFQVWQNGDVIAKNGTFTGDMIARRLDTGLIHLHEDQIVINSTKTFLDDSNNMIDIPVDESTGEVTSFMPLDYQPTAHLVLAPGQCIFNTDMIYGTKDSRKMFYNIGSNQFDMFDTTLSITGAQSDVKIDKSSGAYGGLNIIGKTGGHQILRHSTAGNKLGTLVFDSEGTQGVLGDYSFTRKNYTDNGSCKVHIDGSLSVRERINTEKNNIEMRSATDGWGFYLV